MEFSKWWLFSLITNLPLFMFWLASGGYFAHIHADILLFYCFLVQSPPLSSVGCHSLCGLLSLWSTGGVCISGQDCSTVDTQRVSGCVGG